MPSFRIIGLPVLEKKSFKGFYHIWVWRQSWSSDLGHLYKLLFPLPKEAPHEIRFAWPSGFRGEDVLYNLLFPLPKEAPHEISFDWPSGFRGDV